MIDMQHQEVDFSKPPNQDLVWDLSAIHQREIAERFIRLFESRICVYSDSVSQLYTNYTLHFPKELGRKMVVLPNPYAHHDTLYGIESQAVIPTQLCVLPGVAMGISGLVFSKLTPDGRPSENVITFKSALARIIANLHTSPSAFLPVLVKGDLRAFSQEMPFLHLHRLQSNRLTKMSAFDVDDIQDAIIRKLIELHRDSDKLIC